MKTSAHIFVFIFLSHLSLSLRADDKCHPHFQKLSVRNNLESLNELGNIKKEAQLTIQETEEAYQAAMDELTQADLVLDDYDLNSYYQDILETSKNIPETTRENLVSNLNITNTPENFSFSLAGPRKRTLIPVNSSILGVIDHRTIAINGTSGQTEIMDIYTKQIIKQFPTAAYGMLAKSNDSKYLAMIESSDLSLSIWDLKSGHLLKKIPNTLLFKISSFDLIQFDPNESSSILYIKNDNNEASIRVLNWQDEKNLIRPFLKNKHVVARNLFLSPSGKLLITSNAVLWDRENESSRPFAEELNSVNVRFSPDEKLVYFLNDKGSITVWDLKEWKKIKTYQIEHFFKMKNVYSQILEVSSSGKYLAVESTVGTLLDSDTVAHNIFIIEAATGKRIKTIKTNELLIDRYHHTRSYTFASDLNRKIIFTPDEKYILTNCQNKNFYLMTPL